MAIVSRAHSSERTHYRVTFAVLALAGFPYGLLSLVTPALPLLQRALHASPGATAWLLTGYLLSGSVATPLIGRLGAIYGKKRILVPTLAALADTDNLFVIDDAAQAHRATYGSSSGWSHTWYAGSLGDLGCFSLNGVKNMGGLGDGGLVTVSARLRGMRDLGRYSHARYLHDGWGRRARLDEFTAAECLLEFAELEVWNRRHRQIVACYSAALAHSVVRPPSLPLAAIMPTAITSCSLPR